MDQPIDRRKYPRIKDPMAIRISLDNLQGLVLEDDTYSIDISSGGLCFLSEIDLKPGDRLHIAIIPLHHSIVECGMKLNTSAIVLRSSEIEDKNKKNLVAVKFQSKPQWEAL